MTTTVPPSKKPIRGYLKALLVTTQGSQFLDWNLTMKFKNVESSKKAMTALSKIFHDPQMRFQSISLEQITALEGLLSFTMESISPYQSRLNLDMTSPLQSKLNPSTLTESNPRYKNSMKKSQSKKQQSNLNKF